MKLGHISDLHVLRHVFYACSTRKFVVAVLSWAVQALALI